MPAYAPTPPTPSKTSYTTSGTAQSVEGAPPVSESDPSLSRLLDAVDRRLDIIAGTLSEREATAAAQVATLRILKTLEKARSIANPSSLFNSPRFPPEVLAHVASFFETERDLVTATAVCQRWRAVLLSFPLLWRNAGGSSSEIEAYIQRSKSTQLNVNLSRPELVDLILPHTFRLVGLTVFLNEASDIIQFIERLCDPIPTLRTFRIFATTPYLRGVWLPSDLNSPFFAHSKTLEIHGISWFYGSLTLPHVTELTWDTNQSYLKMDDFLGTLEQLPSLERAYITFGGGYEVYIHAALREVTLSHVQELSLSSSSQGEQRPARFPRILEYLQLPKLEKLSVQVRPWPDVLTHSTVFPHGRFDERFPNFTRLPEMQVDMESCEVIFRSSSPATLKYRTGVLVNYKTLEKRVWKDLPLRSVRRLTVNNISRSGPRKFEDTWLAGLLEDLYSLEALECLELEGECDEVILWLRDGMTQKIRYQIQTLTIRSGEDDAHRAYLKSLADFASLTATAIYVPGHIPG